MTIERAFPSGAWRVSDMVRGYRVERVYYYYTKKEAIQEFKQEFRLK